MHLDGVWGRRYNGGHGIMNMEGIRSGLVFFALQSVAGVGAQLFPVFIEIRDPFVFWETEWSWPWRESVQCRLCGVLDAETRSTFDTCQLSSVQGEQEVSSSVKHSPSFQFIPRRGAARPRAGVLADRQTKVAAAASVTISQLTSPTPPYPCRALPRATESTLFSAAQKFRIFPSSSDDPRQFPPS